MTGERMVTFLDTHITGKYKNHLIIMDNAKAHKTEDVKNEAEKNGNKLLFSIPYQPKTNAIETWFSQLKQLLKLDRAIEFPHTREYTKSHRTYVFTTTEVLASLQVCLSESRTSAT